LTTSFIRLDWVGVEEYHRGVLLLLMVLSAGVVSLVRVSVIVGLHLTAFACLPKTRHVRDRSVILYL
jgi:hypothetical protein